MRFYCYAEVLGKCEKQCTGCKNEPPQQLTLLYNGKDKERMDKVEIWEVLVMLSGNEISLKEAHEQICYLSGVSNRTWSSDEIINQLYQFESIDEAKRWFSEYGC